MTPATRHIEDPKTGCRVMISRQAQFTIGLDKVDDFVKELIKFMVQVEADQAFVSKSGHSVAVYLIWSCR